MSERCPTCGNGILDRIERSGELSKKIYSCGHGKIIGVKNEKIGISENIIPIEPTIFISYFELEAWDLAEAVKEDLRHHGYSAFVAKRDLKKGERQDVVIMKGIRECLIFVPIITSGALLSPWVDREITEAQKIGKRIIPCKHKHVKWLDLAKWNLNDVNGLEFHNEPELLRELIPSILENLGKIQGMNTTFTVRINKPSYRAGETIEVVGTVPAIIEGLPVEIYIFNPTNTLYTIGQPTPNSDGTYSFAFKVGGRLGLNGRYTIKSTYAGQNVQTTFEFTGEVVIEGMVAEFGGKKFFVDATLSNGKIMRIEVDPDYSSIIVPVITNETQYGELEIELPRELIDARTDSEDYTFIVLVDGKESNFTETERTPTARTLKIPVPAKTEEIEIIGTIFVPTEKKQENVVMVMISTGASNISNPRFYVPKEIRISIGTEVIWINADTAGHTVTSGKPGDTDAGSLFDSTKDPAVFLIKPTKEWSQIFHKAGTYQYFCQVHPWEVGRITVID